ncbi:MAG TPA: hypothetical protein VFX47_05880 [Gammaproteobacteria bacterium]|nr:hypothetical protein [Gammaproteobacteria bacterium]
MKYTFLLFVAVLAGIVGGNTALATTAANPQATHSLLPIRSEADLQRYMQTTPHGQSPLYLLPSGARKRFLSSLKFRQHGIGGFSFDDLQVYLTSAQIREVLALFGPDTLSYAQMIQGRKTSLTPAERDAPESVLERKFDALYIASVRSAPAKMKQITAARYDAQFPAFQTTAAIHELDNNDLDLLYRAVDMATFALPDTRHLDDMRRDLVELRQRGLATPSRISMYYSQLIAARELETARALIRTYPEAGLVALPPVQQAGNLTPGAPTVLRLSEDGHHLWHEAISLKVPLRIVVVAGCHFSVDAARAIHADSALNKLFSQHAVWLEDQAQSPAATQDWNREFPDQPIYVAWENSQWSMLDDWLIPTFYVFRHGKLVQEWSGWGDSGMKTLRQKLAAAGVRY